ncbi:MAG: TspO/MBR family protein [Kaiparowitsia implicata GSE-PSE-MK54-09C]|jgi:tryptophan-rich sensory protein|nr:TspO/MBR family protein [Kaiparowitsia implicata GSE-PSE-MK54-09C]
MIQPWMVIGGIAFGLAIAIGSLVNRRGTEWFRRLQRPNWLTFEWAIPVIWTTVFTCGAISATLVWEEDPGSGATWLRMAGYLLLELVTLAYTPAMLWLRRIQVGFVIGTVGLAIAMVLAIAVFPISRPAMYLLIPYLLWSPIGTYVTWEMMQLNPSEA